MDNCYVIVYCRGVGELIVTHCEYMTDPDDPGQIVFTVHAIKEEADE